jgi:hypothetical protein
MFLWPTFNFHLRETFDALAVIKTIFTDNSYLCSHKNLQVGCYEGILVLGAAKQSIFFFWNQHYSELFTQRQCYIPTGNGVVCRVCVYKSLIITVTF